MNARNLIRDFKKILRDANLPEIRFTTFATPPHR